MPEPVSGAPSDLRVADAVRVALAALGSLRLTLALLLALGAGVALASFAGLPMTWLVAVPAAGLALNLGAALPTHDAFRRSPALTVFHLALIALLLLFALGRLGYLKARIEVAEGQAFDGVPVEVEQGPWHPYRLDRVGFVNEHVAIDYSAETTIRRTQNEVRWRDAAGYWQPQTLRENEPFEVLGYRIHVTGGKGFAPRFAWHAADGRRQFGNVHLPRFPSDENAQQAEWTLPDGRTHAWIGLRFDRPPLPAGQPARLEATAADAHHIVLRVGLAGGGEGDGGNETRHELRPGESVALPGGTLEYLGLALWMGYLVHSDWTAPWLLAVAALATLALAAHFLGKYRRPW